MIVLHLLQLNGSVNYYRKWKLICSEVGVKLKNGKIQKSVKNKIAVQIYWTHMRPTAVAPWLHRHKIVDICFCTITY